MECFIDNEDGITPRHCTELSRGILDILSRLEAERSYHLVVSSPGLDRPLSMPWQYKKHVGRTFRIRRRVPAGEETLTGTLVKFDTQGITLSGGRGNMELSVLFEDVLEARVVTPW
jgi:ribosome maturation factor RimP